MNAALASYSHDALRHYMVHLQWCGDMCQCGLYYIIVYFTIVILVHEVGDVETCVRVVCVV